MTALPRHQGSGRVCVADTDSRHAHRQPSIAASRLPHRLQVFVNRVAAHPVLCKSPDLQLFLEATEDTWAVEMARGQVRASRRAEGQPAGRLMPARQCAADAA